MNKWYSVKAMLWKWCSIVCITINIIQLPSYKIETKWNHMETICLRQTAWWTLKIRIYCNRLHAYYNMCSFSIQKTTIDLQLNQSERVSIINRNGNLSNFELPVFCTFVQTKFGIRNDNGPHWTDYFYQWYL